MSNESDLRAAFMANSNLTALIGTRFYPLELPQSATFPAIVYNHTGGNNERSLGGVLISQEIFYQLRLIAESYESLVAVKVAALEVNGNAQGELVDIEITEGPDGYDFDNERPIKILNVTCVT